MIFLPLNGSDIREGIATRVCGRVWSAFSPSLRALAVDSLNLSKMQEIQFRNVSRITIWNQIPR